MRHPAAPLLVAVAILACGGVPVPAPEAPPAEPAPAAKRPSNVLIVILDDVGTEKVAAYGEDPLAPPTPTLSRLASEGVLFRNAWAESVCSPARAAIQTGRYPGRTGIGKIVDAYKPEPDLALDEITLPELLTRSAVAWDSSYAGKWHLGSTHSGDALTHPLRQGYAWFSGTVGNLKDVSWSGRNQRALGYFRWEHVVNGRVSESTTYATTQVADDAITRMATMREPWLMVVGFHAAHVPLHVPPPGLANRRVTDGSPEQDLYDASLEAADRELGRIVASLDGGLRERTTILVIADNGTTKEGVRPPRDPQLAKGSLMEAGINVPLIVTGPDVARPGSESAALVHAVDLFATVADLAGVELGRLPNRVDGRSLLPALRDPGAKVHDYVLSERFAPNGRGPYERSSLAIRDARYKLIHDVGPDPLGDRLHDLTGRHDDGPNLLKRPKVDPEHLRAHERLLAELKRQQASMSAD